MFHLIKLDPDDITFESDTDSGKKYCWFEEIFTHSILDNHYFTRSLASVNNSSVLNLTERSSWTHKHLFQINSVEISEYLKYKYLWMSPEHQFQLLKYQEGDFFNNHIDTKISSNHDYTCLIMINDKENQYQGGELILSDKDNMFNINLDNLKDAECVMVIFSIELFHKIKPITKGTRYVFKIPLFTPVYRPEPTPSYIKPISNCPCCTDGGPMADGGDYNTYIPDEKEEEEFDYNISSLFENSS